MSGHLSSGAGKGFTGIFIGHDPDTQLAMRFEKALKPIVIELTIDERLRDWYSKISAEGLLLR